MSYVSYFKGKDSALMVHPEYFCYKTLRSDKRLIEQVNTWTYAEIAFASLSAVDDRFKKISEGFKQDVVIRSICAEFAVANLENDTKSEIMYPNYLNVLNGINHFALIQKVKADNNFERSILSEISFYKEQYLKQNAILELSEEDKEIMHHIKKLKAS